MSTSLPWAPLSEPAGSAGHAEPVRPIYVNVMTADKRAASQPRVVYVHGRTASVERASVAPAAASPIVQYVTLTAPTGPSQPPPAKATDATPAPQPPPAPTNGVSITANGDNIVIATDGSIVSVGDNTTVTGNTGDANNSG